MNRRNARARSVMRGILGACGVAIIVNCLLPSVATAQQEWPPDSGAPGIRNTADRPAQSFLWSLDTGAGYSDNVALTPVEARGDTILNAGGSLDLDHQGPADSIAVHGRGSLFHYVDNTFSDEFIGGGSALAGYQLVPQFVTWRLEDTFGQVMTDTIRPATPANRENVNVLSTGPELDLPLSTSTSMLLNARFARTVYQRTVADNDQYSGGLSVVHTFSASSSVAINLRDSHTEYSNAANDPYSIKQAYVSLASKGSRSEVTLEAGAAAFDQDKSTRTTPIFRLGLLRRLTPALTLNVGGGVQFLSPSDRFARLQQAAVDPSTTADVVAAAQALREDYVDANLAYLFSRTSISFGTSYGIEHYQNGSADNRDHFSVNVRGERRITPHLSAEAFASWERRAFDILGTEDRTRTAGVSALWRFGLKFSVRVAAEYDKRETTGAENLGYTERRAGIGIVYSPDAIQLH